MSSFQILVSFQFSFVSEIKFIQYNQKRFRNLIISLKFSSHLPRFYYVTGIKSGTDWASLNTQINFKNMGIITSKQGKVQLKQMVQSIEGDS